MTIVDYYNGFRDRLVGDYLSRNERVVAALVFAKEALGDAQTILDVGCGIGWTTDELEATGLDISPVLIETAREMFDRRFVVSEFAAWDPEPFDTVVMIDVYEHFPRESRPAVHQRIRQTGARRVVLTVPTPEALQYARDNNIELQPVDEDVTDADIQHLADDLDGKVAVNRTVTVSRPNDYRHVLIEC
jgi:cyclopropane fatty-acyl-phospholipid synthase-like methyltransferase